MKQKAKILAVLIAGGLSLLGTAGGVVYASAQGDRQSSSEAALIKQGQWVFRFDTLEELCLPVNMERQAG